jgi:hypothetical protein
MTSKTFTSGTVIDSPWLNDVNTATYTSLPALQTKTANLPTVSTFAGTMMDDVDAAGVRTTIVAAASGANTDITSLSGPALGAATATTQTAGDSSTKVATTAFVTGGSVALTGAQTIAGVKTFSSQPVLPQALTLGTAKTLSGSSSTFTGIPSWVNRITVSFIGVSTNGIINIYLQLGSTAGGIAATGYGGSTATLVNGSAAAVVTPTTYAAIGTYGVASASFSGQAVISRISSTAWAIASNVGHYANNATSIGAYSVDIGNVLDRIQLSTSDTFDAGSWNILYE